MRFVSVPGVAKGAGQQEGGKGSRPTRVRSQGSRVRQPRQAQLQELKAYIAVWSFPQVVLHIVRSFPRVARFLCTQSRVNMRMHSSSTRLAAAQRGGGRQRGCRGRRVSFSFFDATL